MSYQRAWQLVQVMNALFHDPLVAVSRGGGTGGGAQLTPTAKRCSGATPAWSRPALTATRRDWQALVRLLHP